VATLRVRSSKVTGTPILVLIFSIVLSNSAEAQ
jgi:hypothetical protein